MGIKSRDGRVQVFFHFVRLFLWMTHWSLVFFLRNIVNFTYILFVLSLNDCSLKSFVFYSLLLKKNNRFFNALNGPYTHPSFFLIRTIFHEKMVRSQTFCSFTKTMPISNYRDCHRSLKWLFSRSGIVKLLTFISPIAWKISSFYWLEMCSI